ncbi:uncharacterized protein [Argopecten irradians]|uniref:uncharacterized protein n=1 Tax=Argopecten irradians TaxID=31199 RepID=UPI003716757E
MRTAMQFVTQGCYCFKFDIHSAYHHIEIFEPHTNFLGFSWVFGNKVRYFKFMVLPFGLSSACYIYTKVTRPLVKKWRGEGKQILMYLDDGLGVHSDESACAHMASQVKHDLIASGFVPKPEKSTWIPVRKLVFLGNSIDTVEGILSITQPRLDKLSMYISDVLEDIRMCGRVPVRKVASAVGQIVSMSYVLGNVVYIMTKSLSVDISESISWNSAISLSDDSVKQLNFWGDNVSDLNVRNFTEDCACHTVVYSDASNTGYGGYVVDTPNGTAHGMWSDAEKEQSSTWRELTAVRNVFMSMEHLLRDKRVKWFTDNQNVVRIVSRGSMKPCLQEIAYTIFRTCLRTNVSLDVEWIPRDLNDQADVLSRLVDSDDWSVSDEIFQWLEGLWGPHEIDWFANHINSKLPVFYSRHWSIESNGVDAFTADWFGVNGWFVPPVCIVHRVLKYMRQCSAYGTMVVPLWRSASFWPFLCPTGDGYIPEVVGMVYLPTNKQSYMPGRGNKYLFGNVDLPFRMLALRLDFRGGGSGVY